MAVRDLGQARVGDREHAEHLRQRRHGDVGAAETRRDGDAEQP